MRKLIAIILSICFIYTTVLSSVYALDGEDDTEVHSDVISQETTTNDSNSDLNSESNQISEGTQVNGNDDENNNVEEPTDKNDVSITNEVSANIEYSTHVEDIGWQPYVQEGKMAGTSGESKRLESIKIRLINSNVEGSISYATHIQNLGWTDFVENDTISGTVGQKLRLEAIKIKLNGEIANYYDVYYRVHVQNIGWLDWACNGMAAGTASYSYRLEGIEIRLVKKGEAAPGPTNKTFISPGKIYYSSHVQDTGWQKNVGDGKLSGTEAESKRIEAIKIYLDNAEYAGNVEYDISVQNIGWQGYKNNGEVAGTIGQKKHVEAVKIRITGEIATYYDVYYRVHVQEFGWLSWAKNDEMAGTNGYGYRVEAIEVVLIPKGESAPGDTTKPYQTPGNIYYSTHVEDIGWLNSMGDGGTSGTIGKSKQVEAIKINVGNIGYSGDVEYSTHIQDVGWQEYKKNGDIAGTIGDRLQVEAIKIRLTGEIATYYDVYYRTHVQNFGWLSWTLNDQKAGSEGISTHIEAIEIVLVPKGGSAPGDTSRPFIKGENIFYSSHVQGVGWMEQVSNGATSGTQGKNLRLEAIKITLSNENYEGNVEYSAHIQDIGWQNYVSNGAIAGTENESRRIEAIKIRLTGEIANYFDVYYRVYCQNIGWLDWTCNDNPAGTIGASYRIEAIQIKTYIKGAAAPGASSKACLTFKNNNGYLVCYDNKGQLCEDIEKLYILQGAYDLRVNKATNVVTALAQDGNGKEIIAYKRFVCSTGINTPSGVYYTPAKYRWRELMGPSYGQYSTRIVNGILFHSVPYNKMNIYTLSARMYNQLGTTCSHGCIRLTCADAKWIYDNCPLGTKVIIVEGGRDPLSKPVAQKIPLTQTWDPTDPAI